MALAVETAEEMVRRTDRAHRASLRKKNAPPDGALTAKPSGDRARVLVAYPRAKCARAAGLMVVVDADGRNLGAGKDSATAWRNAAVALAWGAAAAASCGS